MRLRDLINLVESMENRDRTFFHVTLSENLQAVMDKGIHPTIGDRSKKLKLNSCVFLFPSEADAEAAVEGWMTEQYRDEEKPSFALLEVTLPAEIEVFVTEDRETYFVRETIDPSCIRILKRDF